MNKVRFMYIRDNSWSPIGCLAIRLESGKNRVTYGLSMRNPKDAVNTRNRSVKFDRQTARQLALANLDVGDKCSFVYSGASMTEITDAVMKDIVAHAKAPSRAIRFAENWIRTYGI